jgi:hypothetical protein
MYFEKGDVFLDAGKIINNTSRKSDGLAAVPAALLLKPPSFLPVWMAAYNYPGNVNKDGAIVLPEIPKNAYTGFAHTRFPYSFFYETVIR